MIRSATTWRGRPAVHLASDRLHAVVTCMGAQLACLRLPGETLNPLWQPAWERSDDPLLDVVCGSNVCIDRFGPPWPGEDRPMHGEAGQRIWETAREGDAAVFRTQLPIARLAIERRFRFVAEGLELTTSAVPLDGGPRAIEWCEHTTLGDPFLDGVEISAGIAEPRGMPGYGPAAGIRPLPAPAAGDPPRGDIAAGRVLAGWWRARNPLLGRTLSATWEAAEFPWLCLWTEHRARTSAPWNGRERARGMELATKPFPDGIPGPDACFAPSTKRVVFGWG